MHLLNVYGVLRELAEQELIQKPYLMVYTWTTTLTYLKTLKDFDTPESELNFMSNQQQREWLNFFILTQRVRGIERHGDFLCNIFKV